MVGREIVVAGAGVLLGSRWFTEYEELDKGADEEHHGELTEQEPLSEGEAEVR